MTAPAAPPLADLIAELRRLHEEATPAPWVAEKSMRDDCSVHLAIRTVEKDKRHPHSPRFVAWLTGMLREYLPPTQRPRFRYCEKCEHGYWEGRTVPVEVREDLEVETDAALLVALRNAAPHLLAAAERAEEMARTLEAFLAPRVISGGILAGASDATRCLCGCESQANNLKGALAAYRGSAGAGET